jgi:hypothetical protein
MSDFNFLYELHNKSGECVMTQSVTGKRISPMLEHIARIVNEHKDVTVHVLKARVGESVLVDPQRMESLSALVTMGVEHYNAKAGDLVVENAYSKSLDETLMEVMSNPKKMKKLMEWMTAAQQERMRKIIPPQDSHGKVIQGMWSDDDVKDADKRRKAAREKAKSVKEGEDDDTLKLPDLNTGDTLLVGKFKNRRAEIKGFSKDENNQPVADTTKGDQKIFKPRIAKIMPGAEMKKPEEPVAENVQGDVRKNKEAHPEKYCSNAKCLWRASSGPCPKHSSKAGSGGNPAPLRTITPSSTSPTTGMKRSPTPV